MKFLDKRLNESVEINEEIIMSLIKIKKKQNHIYCFCKLKNKNCFDSLEYNCPNYRELLA